MEHKFTLKKKILISSMSILILALSISGGFFSYSYYQIRRDDAFKGLDLVINTVEDSLSSHFASIDNLAFNFLSTYHVRSWINNEISFVTNNEMDYINASELQKEITYSLIFNEAWQKQLVDSASLFAEGEYIPLVSRIPEKKEIIQKNDEAIYELVKQNNLGSYFLCSTIETPQFYYVKKINNISFDKELTLVLAINKANFAKALYNLPENYTTHLSDKSGQTFIATNTSPTSASSKQVQLNRSIEGTTFTVSVSIPRGSITHPLVTSFWDYIGIMFIFILIFVLLAAFVLDNYTCVIDDLLNHIEQIRLKNYTRRMPVYKDPQLNAISSTFNTMTQEFQDLINKVFKSELLLKDAEIKLMQSQMNPHFLLNTLTTISTKALMSGNTEVYEMVAALSTLLSASLYGDQQSFCKIQDELEYIKMYLYLQHIRFEDKLQYTIHVQDESLLNYFIPRLSIEPIVENAVIHGLKDNVDSGIVSINICLDEHVLLFTITDNGAGFDVEQVLNHAEEDTQRRPHIGIYNTNKRLQLIYGEAYGVTFKSEKDKGTIALIKIPIIEQTLAKGEV